MKNINIAHKLKRPFTVYITLFFLAVIALVWLAYSFFIALGGDITYFNILSFKWIVSGTAFFGVLVLIALCFFLHKGNKPAWFASVILLSIVIVSSFFEWFRWFDFFLIALYLIPLGLLIKDRKWYLVKPDSLVSPE